MKTTVLDQDIKDAIPMANKFAEDMGIAAKKADANKETPSNPKEQTAQIASELKNRKTADGEDLDIETTDNGSMVIGIEHGANTESTKQTIDNIQKLPKDTKVMFVGEGGMGKDDSGKIEFGEEQDEIRNAVKGHFNNAEESSWDENANVYDDNSPVYKDIENSLGSKSKAMASVWTNMVGQGDDMNADDYLDDDGRAWIIDQAKKGGATSINDNTDFNNLTDDERNDLYQLNYRDDDGYGETEISKGQEAYNGFRQKELDRKIKEAEDNGYTVIAPVGNSHVDMWRQRNKKSSETKPTKDDIKKEEPGKKAETDSGSSLYSIGGGYYSDKPNGPAKYVRTESVIEMAFDDNLNEDVFALFEKTITGTLQNGEKIKVQELPPKAVAAATQKAKVAAASYVQEPTQTAQSADKKPAEQPTNDTEEKSDIQNVTSLPEPKPEDPEEKKSWFQKQKERIKQKFKVMKEAGKQFFNRGGHKPGSVPRRSFGQALIDKIKGIPKAVADGIIHHAVMFKDAGVAIFEAGAYGGLGTIEDPETGERFNHDDYIAVDENGKKRYEKIPQYETDSHGHVINDPETGKPMQKRHWLTGNLIYEDRPIPKEDISDKQKELFYKSYQKEKKQIKAIVGTGKAIMITAAGAYGLSAVMGHAYTTAGQLLTSTAIELVPHTIVEGVVLGTAKAALFAGATEMNHNKKLEEFSTNLVKTIGEFINGDKEIPADVLANSMELYNNVDKLRENMDKIPDDEAFLKDYVELYDQIEKDNKSKKEMTEENLQLADELMLEMIYGFIDESTYPKSDDGKYWVKSKKTGNVYTVIAPKPAQHDVPNKRDIKNAGGTTTPQAPTKKLGAGDFRKTPDMKPAVKKASVPAKKERVETNNPHKKNGDEGKTILEIKPEELDSILEKYVNTGEATPDDMRELAPDYSNQDMADGYSDDDYYSTSNGGRKHSSLVRKEPYKVDKSTRTKLKESGFPEKYIKFLERCINTQVKGKKPPVTELIKQGGAGQIQSQFGEVMAMAFMSMRDPQQRRQLADIMSGEIAKSAQEFGGGKQSPIATKDWVEASLTHAEAFDSAMDEKYGKGQWRFEGAAWDIRGDVESLGLDYKNKGFSTDVMLRVQPLDKNGKPNGPARAQKNSLKKDENIFFFNGSINEVNNFVLNFLDDKERKRVRGYEAIVTKAGASNKNPDDKAAALAAAERITGLKGAKAIAALKQMAADIRTKAFDSAPPHVQKAVSKVRNFGAAQTKSAETLIKTANTNIRNANNVIDNAKNIDGGDKDFAKFAYKAVKDCKASGTKDITTCIRQKLSAAGEDTTDDRVCKVAVLASKVAIAAGDTKAEKALSKHYNLAVEAGNALMEVLPDSPELMGGLMQKLADAFPMKTCMQGEEFMCIDGMKVTQKTLQTVFGVANYEELQKGMKLKRLPSGETILVYGAKTKDGKDIPIGVVGARQKGKGYEGTVGFEISCSDDFALAISEANYKNGDTSESNEKARQSIGKRVNNRAAKANKKK